MISLPAGLIWVEQHGVSVHLTTCWGLNCVLSLQDTEMCLTQHDSGQRNAVLTCNDW